MNLRSSSSKDPAELVVLIAVGVAEHELGAGIGMGTVVGLVPVALGIISKVGWIAIGDGGENVPETTTGELGV
jgi:hypothetical protein